MSWRLTHLAGLRWVLSCILGALVLLGAVWGWRGGQGKE
jgi:hypothetical protein